MVTVEKREEGRGREKWKGKRNKASLSGRGIGIRELTRLGDPSPKVHPGAFSGQRQGWKTPKRAVYCFCVCSGSALLGDLLGFSRSRERDFLSVLLICWYFLACIYCISSLSRVSFCVIVFCYMFMCVSCFG